jgi:hypothetical protein
LRDNSRNEAGRSLSPREHQHHKPLPSFTEKDYNEQLVNRFRSSYQPERDSRSVPPPAHDVNFNTTGPQFCGPLENTGSFNNTFNSQKTTLPLRTKLHEQPPIPTFHRQARDPFPSRSASPFDYSRPLTNSYAGLPPIGTHLRPPREAPTPIADLHESSSILPSRPSRDSIGEASRNYTYTDNSPLLKENLGGNGNG